MPDKDEDARRLAAIHYEVEPAMVSIFRLRAGEDVERRPTEPIKLLEVNEFTIPSGIMPLTFRPAPASGIHFPSIIVEVTPEEYEKIQTHELVLPSSWSVHELIPRPVPS